jgi:exopolysaccharide biosynthesis polyprenyl glycosylphosphotransferase
LIIVLPLWLGALHFMGAYRELRVKPLARIVWIVLKASVVSLLLFGSMVFILKLQYVSRTFMLFFFLLSFCNLILERALLIECWHIMSRRHYFHRNILIVGTGPRARKFIKAIQAHKDWGLRLAGLLDIDPKLLGQSILGYKILGTLEDLPRVMQELVIDEVIFVVPRSWMNRIEQSILYCESVGVRASLTADLFNMNFAKAQATDFDGIPVLSFETTPADEWRLAVKRIGDVFVALGVLFFLAPVFPLIAMLIKGTSPGPIFFKQVRCGVNGRRFTLYKLRSMVIDAEERLEKLKHLNEMDGPVFKLTNDPRFTPIGKWLRKTSIDELPQLYNVLKGEMSLVGPRPPIPQEVARYAPWQIRRLSMRPGITGFWQVNGRNEIKDFDEWVKLDLRYIDEWSLSLDTKILLKTIPVALFGKGAR